MRATIHTILGKAGSILYPHICLNCGAAGEDGIDFCSRCYQNLPWIEFACKRCALPLATESASICGACSNRKIYFDQAFVPLLFDEFVRDAIHQFKFNHKLNYGKLLATLLLRQILLHQLTLPDVLIPVPLHRNRIRNRGFNQALEIARILNKQIGSTINKKNIRRVRSTHAQMDLPAAKRQANVKNAFQLLTTDSSLKGKHVVIIDDVMTTGSTVNEVAKCLKKAQARQIDVWCIARVSTGKTLACG